MSDPTARATFRVAPNGINTIAIPLLQLTPLPERVGGVDQLPEPNPSIRLELPEPPDDTVRIGVEGTSVGPRDMFVHERTVYFAVPPVVSSNVVGRVSYQYQGLQRLLRFALVRCASMAEVMDSLQTQFDNVSAFIELGATGRPPEERDFLYERAHDAQVRIINAMEPMPMPMADYTLFVERTRQLTLTPPRAP